MALLKVIISIEFSDPNSAADVAMEIKIAKGSRGL
jgi:hypothetical protein